MVTGLTVKRGTPCRARPSHHFTISNNSRGAKTVCRLPFAVSRGSDGVMVEVGAAACAQGRTILCRVTTRGNRTPDGRWRPKDLVPSAALRANSLPPHPATSLAVTTSGNRTSYGFMVEGDLLQRDCLASRSVCQQDRLRVTSRGNRLLVLWSSAWF
jgi:hypothetical protein